MLKVSHRIRARRLRNRSIAVVTAGVITCLGLGLAGPAQAQGKGSIEFGLSSHFNWPVQDLSRLEPAFDRNYLGLILHYWLNDSTSVVAGINDLSFVAPFEVDGAEDNFNWGVTILFVGARYRPPLDLLFKPYLEAGIGYQAWRVENTPAVLESRDGGTIAYFAGAGLEYDVLHQMTAGLNLRYFHTPMAENLETEAWSNPLGKPRIEETSIDGAGYLTLGFEFTYRFK